MKIVVTEMPKHPTGCLFVGGPVKGSDGKREYKCSIGKKGICKNPERCRKLKTVTEILVKKDLI